MYKLRPPKGAGIYTYTPVVSQTPPARPSQAENRPGPVYMYIRRPRKGGGAGTKFLRVCICFAIIIIQQQRRRNQVRMPASPLA